jgi:hypothetical protein
MDTKISFRLPSEITERARNLMRRKGIMKMSDFVRQALVSHLTHEGLSLDQVTAAPAAKATKGGAK